MEQSSGDSSIEKAEIVKALSHKGGRLWVYELANDLKAIAGFQKRRLDYRLFQENAAIPNHGEQLLRLEGTCFRV